MLVNTDEKRAFFGDLYERGDLGAALDFCRAERAASSGDEYLRWSNNAALTLWALGRFGDALETLAEASDAASEARDHALVANYRNNASLARWGLYVETGDQTHADTALVELEGARDAYARAGERKREGTVENNLGLVLVALGLYREALPHLERARAIYLKAGEPETAAEVDDTEARARLLLGEKEEAEKLAARAVAALACAGRERARLKARQTLRDVLAELD